MDIKERVIDGISVLDFSGPLTLGEPCRKIQEMVGSLLSDGQRRIIVNLADLTEIDRAGTDTLLKCQRTVEKEAGKFKFKIALPPTYGFWGSLKRTVLFQKQLNPTQLLSVVISGLECHQDVKEAVASFDSVSVKR